MLAPRGVSQNLGCPPVACRRISYRRVYAASDINPACNDAFAIEISLCALRSSRPSVRESRMKESGEGDRGRNREGETRTRNEVVGGGERPPGICISEPYRSLTPSNPLNLPPARGAVRSRLFLPRRTFLAFWARASFFRWLIRF